MKFCKAERKLQKMADYHPLIARAVEGLGSSSGEARRSLYERARSALVSQLRAIEPPLSEADITRERLALEDAIRKVEAESVRKARTEPRPSAPPLRPSTPSARPQPSPTLPPPPPPPRRDRPSPAFGDMPPRRSEPRWPESQRINPPPPPPPSPSPQRANEAPDPVGAQSARSRLLNARTPQVAREGFKGFRDVVNEVDDLGGASAQAAQSARDTRDFYGADSPEDYSEDDALAPHDRIEPQFDTEDSDILKDEPPRAGTLEPYDLEDEEPMLPPQARSRPSRGREPEDHYEGPRPPRSYRGLAKFAVVLIILAGLTATVSWQWSNITGLYNFVSHLRSKQTQTAQTPAAAPKSDDRVPQPQTSGQAPGTPATANQNAPAVAQRVVLYEEDPSDPAGKRYVGSAIWRTETVSPGSGLAPELQVRADITVPDKNMTVTLTLRRNTDQALPASHTIEIMFNLPPDFAGGGIANVPGVLMKESEQARGVPLAGLAVKVTNGFFLIGLSAVDADVQRNMQLLKDRPWFDIPIVYNNGGRAILALEKGPPGDRAFADAFAAWGK
jgi:hypothetical protein